MNLNDELNLHDDDRLREVATILAASILRLRARVALPTEKDADSKNLPKSDQNSLEVPGETVLSVHTG